MPTLEEVWGSKCGPRRYGEIPREGPPAEWGNLWTYCVVLQVKFIKAACWVCPLATPPAFLIYLPLSPLLLCVFVTGFHLVAQVDLLLTSHCLCLPSVMILNKNGQSWLVAFLELTYLAVLKILNSSHFILGRPTRTQANALTVIPLITSCHS